LDEKYINYTKELNTLLLSLNGANTDLNWELLNSALMSLIYGSGDGAFVKSLIKNYLYCSFFEKHFCSYVIFLLNSKLTKKDRMLVLSGLVEGGE
jgi:hypothetical protein